MPISNPEEIIAFHTPEGFRGERFYIPDYQRGYRWTTQEIEDLLNDVRTFMERYPNDAYSMQPIVVKRKNDKWEVIDGQQRLTSVLIILQALEVYDFYEIDYAVLDKSREYVARISTAPDDEINLWYMKEALQATQKWIEKNVKEDGKNTFREYIIHKLKFLWYRTDLVDGNNTSGEQIFQRLNIGKIELTQSELIKALFLSNDLFVGDSVDRRSEIATQWDDFEAMFQNDEFWYFLTNEKSSDSPNRIEFLLKRLTEIYKAEYFDEELLESIDTKDGLFRAYYQIFQKDKHKLSELWNKAIDLMDITRFWYEDVTLYHLIGFEIYKGQSLGNLLQDWSDNTIPSFRRELAYKILTENQLDLSKVYGYFKDERWIDNKRQSMPILLLANVLCVLRQNISHERNADYSQGIFYKFPFHLFKKQIKGKGKGWDIEHIASATDNDLDELSEQRDWICSAYMSLTPDLKREFMAKNRSVLSDFFSDKVDDDGQNQFSNMYKELTDLLGLSNLKIMTTDEKNRITNFALLDFSTNRLYKNAIFATKRQHVRNKEIGKLKTISWNKEKNDFEETTTIADSAFVPPCTKDVFTKTYSNVVADSLQWGELDASDYGTYLTELFDWFNSWSNKL